MTLLDLTRELFAYLVSFRQRAASALPPSLETVRQELDALWQTMEERAREHPLLGGPLAKVRYSLAALCDEVLLTSQWPPAPRWAADSLEARLFGSRKGGAYFFENLARQAQAPKDVLAIHYLCLALGFRGSFAADDPRLAQIKADLLARLQQAPAPGAALPPAPGPEPALAQPLDQPPGEAATPAEVGPQGHPAPGPGPGSLASDQAQDAPPLKEPLPPLEAAPELGLAWPAGPPGLGTSPWTSPLASPVAAWPSPPPAPAGRRPGFHSRPVLGKAKSTLGRTVALAVAGGLLAIWGLYWGVSAQRFAADRPDSLAVVGSQGRRSPQARRASQPPPLAENRPQAEIPLLPDFATRPETPAPSLRERRGELPLLPPSSTRPETPAPETPGQPSAPALSARPPAGELPLLPPSSTQPETPAAPAALAASAATSPPRAEKPLPPPAKPAPTPPVQAPAPAASPPPAAPPVQAGPSAPAPAGGYLLHAGLFVGPVQSGRLAKRLQDIGYRAWVRQEERQGKTRYLVLLGPFPDEAQAGKAADDISRRLRISPFLVPQDQPAAPPPQGSH